MLAATNQGQNHCHCDSADERGLCDDARRARWPHRAGLRAGVSPGHPYFRVSEKIPLTVDIFKLIRYNDDVG